MIKLFKINKESEQQEVRTITPDNTYYAAYDKYLQMYYLTDIEENEDFIPMDFGEEIILILMVDKDNPIEVEEVFDVMQDQLYMRA